MKQTNYMPKSQLTRASFQPRNNSTNTWPTCCTDCIPCCTDRKLHTVSLWPNRRMMAV